MTGIATTPEVVTLQAGAAPHSKRRRSTRRRFGREATIGWLFLLPATVFYLAFVLWPIISTINYSFYDWNGITPATFVGVQNYVALVTQPELLGSIVHAFELIVFFSLVPTALGLVIAATIRGISGSTLAGVARVVLFLPQIIPLVAAGIIWTWLLSTDGLVNQLLRLVGLGSVTRAWLGDFNWALPAVGVIGAWVLLGLCTLLLLSGMSKLDTSLSEAARLDGAGAVREFRSITVPLLKAEIGVCITVTVIAALASFDIIYISTQGGPGNSTMVPGLQIFYLAFTQREVGLASALAVALMVLVLAVVLPIQRIFRGSEQ